MQTLKFGSKGEDVKKLQSYLNLCVDGIFGKRTEESVKQFQKDNGLVADRIFTADTDIQLGVSGIGGGLRYIWIIQRKIHGAKPVCKAA